MLVNTYIRDIICILNINMKVCLLCHQPKEVEEFPFRTTLIYKQKTYKYRVSYCKDCRSTYGKNHHAKNRKACQDSKRNRIERNRNHILDYLKSNPCVDCGESDVIVLDFDHISGTKRAGVCAMAQNGVGLEVLKEEISKCEVRCCNDHRRRTMAVGNQWRVKKA